MASSSLDQIRAGTTMAALHSDIIETHLLTKLDGPSLVSAASTCQLLNTLCNKESLWEDICTSTWNSTKHPLVRQMISSFPGGYRSFYSDSFPVLRAGIRPRMLRGHTRVLEMISAVDLHFEDKFVYSKVIVMNTSTNTSASGFAGPLFSVDLMKCKETVEILMEEEGNEHACMSRLEDGLRLSWIVVDPALKRAGNMSSLRPVSVRPHWDGTGVKVIYATFLSGDCCGIDTTKVVECRIVTIFKCDEGKKMKLRELSLCVVDMARTRLDRGKSLRILEAAMERGDRKKENGDLKKMYGKYLEFKRKKKEEQKRRQDKICVVLGVFQDIIWVIFVVCLISWLWPA